MSTDNGKTWYVSSNGLKANSIVSLNIDAQNNFYANNDHESYKSTDNGKSWKCSFLSAEVWFDKYNYIYQPGSAGLLKSTSGGQEWQLIYSEENRAIKKVWFDAQNNIFMLFNRGGDEIF